jgi:uncharacterized membrane protein YqiK
VRALPVLKEYQVCAREEYKGWYRKVGARFKPEVLDEAMKAPAEEKVEKISRRRELKIVSQRRNLELGQSATECDPNWRHKAQTRSLEVKEAHHERFQLLQQKWMESRRKRLTKEPPREGAIESICNNPYKKR